MRSVHIAADSISMQYGPYVEKHVEGHIRYSRKPACSADGTPFPTGANGGDSAQLLNYLQICDQESAIWDIVLVNAGLHDVRRRDGKLQIGLDDYLSNVELILRQARSLAKYVVWATTTPVPDDLHNQITTTYKRYNNDVITYNSAVNALTERLEVPTVDLYGFTQNMGLNNPYRDHVHFNADALRLQGSFVARHLLTAAKTIDT